MATNAAGELTDIGYLPPGEVDPDGIDPAVHKATVAAEDEVRERFRSLFSAYPGSSATGQATGPTKSFKQLFDMHMRDLQRGQGTGTPFSVGGMVAFMLKPEDAAKIALPGGEPADELHCTLNVLDDDDAHAFPIKLVRAIEMAIEGQGPLTARIGGILMFPPSDSSDGKVPLCLTVDCPGLERLQLKLSDTIGEWAMVERAGNHGYTPHVCLDYLDKGETPPFTMMPAIEVVFDTVSLVRKDGFRRDFPLTGQIERKSFDAGIAAWEAQDPEFAAEMALARYNPDQPRDAHGRFGSGGESQDPIIKQEHRDEPQQLSLIKATGGFTYTPVAGAFVGIGQQGYGVSPYPEHETIIEGRATTAADLHSYIRQNEEILKQPNHYAGAWFDPEASKTYLDISIVAKTEQEATALSEKYHQAAYFDYKQGETVYTHSRQAVARRVAGWYSNGRADRRSSREAASSVGSEPEGQVTRYSDDEERDNHGRWTAGGGDGAADKPLPDPGALHEAWAGMSAGERLAVGNVGAIDAQMGRTLAGMQSSPPQHQDVGKAPSVASYAAVGANAQAQLASYREQLPSDGYRMASAELDRGLAEMQAAGLPASGDMRDLDKYMANTVSALVYQERMGWERQLGDHGFHHIIDDAQTTRTIMREVGGSTPQEQATTAQATMYHDIGYTADAARVSFDATTEHPAYGAQYVKDHADMFDKVFGKDGTARITDLITEHQGAEIDWKNDPTGSALRVADNLGLFAKEKEPPIFRYVPGAADSLKELSVWGSRTGTTENVRADLRDHINSARLPSEMKAGMLKAVDEVTPATAKFTLGMFAGERGAPKYDGKTLDVPIRYSSRAAEIQQFYNVGQRQFEKLGESYGMTEADTARGVFIAKDASDTPILRVHVTNPPKGTFGRRLQRYSDDEDRDDHGRWTNGGGNSSTQAQAPVKATITTPDNVKVTYYEAPNGDKEAVSARMGIASLVASKYPEYEAKQADLTRLQAGAEAGAKLVESAMMTGGSVPDFDKYIVEDKAYIDAANKEVFEKVIAQQPAEGAKLIDAFVGSAMRYNAVGDRINVGIVAASRMLPDYMAQELPKVEFNPAKVGNTRAFYEAGPIGQIVGARDAETVVHELGHHIEANSPGVQAVRAAMVWDRTRGEELQPLAAVTGLGYGKDEMAFPDKFANPYMGKQYTDSKGQSSEVLSMSMELMYKDPIGFAQKDPRSFDFAYNALRGKYR